MGREHGSALLRTPAEIGLDVPQARPVAGEDQPGHDRERGNNRQDGGISDGLHGSLPSSQNFGLISRLSQKPPTVNRTTVVRIIR